MLYPQQWYLLFVVGVWALYWTLCRTPNHKKLFLLLSSLGLLFVIQMEFTLVLIAWTLAVYLISRHLRKDQVTHRGLVLLLAIVAVLAYLAFYKYLPVLLHAVLGSGVEAEADWITSSLIVPLGLSYFTFKFLHYLINAYRGQLVDHEPLDFFLYTAFFPIVPAGPIERIERFVGNAHLEWDPNAFAYGLQRIILGAAKKLLLVDSILIHFATGSVAVALLEQDYQGLGLVEVWTFLIACFLYAYLDFSAYTDLAVGTARLFGFKICENFRFPIFQPNLSEFWQRWHMSLTSWCRDYVYMPVLGQTRHPRLALYASMMTLGAWHQLNVNWLVWGALHATGLVTLMHWHRLRARLNMPVSQTPSLIGHTVGAIVTFMFVSWVFAFVCIPDPEAALKGFVFAATGITW